MSTTPINADTLRRFAAEPMAFLEALIIPSAHGSQHFGDCMADFQRARFESLIPALLAVARDEKPQIGRHWWEATKGASKDSDLACALLWLLAFTPRPLDCQIGAADADQADELRKAAKDVLHLNRWLAERVSIQTWKIRCEATGSSCEIIAADIAGSHGARPDVLILNELSHVTKREFAENLMDNAAKVPHGLVVIATNAGFTGTWQYRWRELARTSDRWSFSQWAQPSPWLDADEMEEAKQRNSPARYLRLWWGVWSSGAGDAIDAEDIAACTDEELPPMTAREPGYGFCAGLDIGLKRDHSGLVVLARHHKSPLIRVAHVQAWRPPAGGSVDIEEVEAAILSLHRLFRLHRLNTDPWQAVYLGQRLRKAGVPVSEVAFTGKSLDGMASELMTVFRERRLRMFPGRLSADVAKLTIEEKSFGYKLTSARDDEGHADTGTALALALLGVKDMPASLGGTWGGVIKAGDQSLSSFGSVISRPLGQGARSIPRPEPTPGPLPFIGEPR